MFKIRVKKKNTKTQNPPLSLRCQPRGFERTFLHPSGEGFYVHRPLRLVVCVCQTFPRTLPTWVCHSGCCAFEVWEAMPLATTCSCPPHSRSLPSRALAPLRRLYMSPGVVCHCVRIIRYLCVALSLSSSRDEPRCRPNSTPKQVEVCTLSPQPLRVMSVKFLFP